MNKLQSLAARMNDLRKQMQEEGEAAIVEAVSELFNKYSELQAIQWRAYVPYFNDGDACTFGFYGLKYQTPDMEGDFEDIPWRDKTPIQEDLSKLERTLEGMSELLETCFGSHQEVTVTREGIQVEDYSDHD